MLRLLTIASVAASLSLGQAQAHVVLSQKTFEAGMTFAAFFQVEHGCDGSPTLSLRVDIPADVTVLQVPEKPGWATNAERKGDRVAAVSWRGRLEGGEKDQFGLLLKLPQRVGALYFPIVQRCAKGEMRWTETPTADGAKLARPAPSLLLTATETHPSSFMAGDIMVMQAWSRATPPGAATAVGYLTVMNHGKTADTLLGGSTPVADRLEMHQTSMTGGIMAMRPAGGGIDIPPEASVTFKPEGGYHLMLTGLKAPLKAGTHIPATLNFAKAGAINIELSVEAIGALAPAGSGHP